MLERPSVTDDATLAQPTGRRILFFTLVGATMIALIWLLAVALSAGGFSPGDLLLVMLFAVTLPWSVIGFWNATIGLLIMRFARDPVAAVTPAAARVAGNEPIVSSTAILVCIRNEPPERVIRHIVPMIDGLVARGVAHRFHVYILSDTGDLAHAAIESRQFGELANAVRGRILVTYRRREHNVGFKAGNVRDFCDRWGKIHDFAVVLDADSLMTADAVLRLVRIMQASPQLGILQSLVTGAPSQSAFARAFQFGMRHGMRSYTMGNAWWNGDCGPYWGHNALVRVAPFARFCELPVLPGKAPLGGYILSHDQIEATLMRAAGYEVRVLPVESESWEENPPSILEYTKRDLRWCQGNMQYWGLVTGLPGLVPMSRFQIGMGIFMYLAALAWTVMIVLSTLKVFDPEIGAVEISLGIWLFAASFFITMMPKIMGMLDVVFTPGGMARYGGPFKFLASSLTEMGFSIMLSPVAAVRLGIFMLSLPFGRSVIWSGQQRDVHRLTWMTALKGLWPQTLLGMAIFAVLSWKAPGVLYWAAPLLSGLLLSVPFAVLTASPRVGKFMARIGLCGIPEERIVPRDLRGFTDPDIQQGDPDSPAGSSRRFAPAMSS